MKQVRLRKEKKSLNPIDRRRRCGKRFREKWM